MSAPYKGLGIAFLPSSRRWEGSRFWEQQEFPNARCFVPQHDLNIDYVF
ncbi:hypothetical protein [Reichenbachiella versicolor]|nr:hypothetical protein [Reichenbachiella versicolor]